jgi:hypothetical protein
LPQFTLLMVLLAVAVWPGIILGWESFYLHDFGAVFYPQFAFFKDRFINGELPLWNPYSNCGVPFLAQWVTLTLYPPCLIFLLLPLPASLGWFCLLHFCLAGNGMFCLVRHWTRHGFGAAFAGLCYAFSGLMLSSHTFPIYWVALAWMPWIVLAAGRALAGHSASWRWTIIGGTMQMLSGAVELILQTWVIVLVLWLSGLCERRRGRFRRWTRAAGVVVLITGLAAIQLLPFFELLGLSERHGQYAARLQMEWAMPARGLANFFVPLLDCFRTPQGVFIPQGQTFFLSYYLGAATLGLAVLGLMKCRDQPVRILAGLGLLGLLLSLGDTFPVMRYLKQLVPAFEAVRYPVKFLVLPAFAVPVLAGYGIRSLESARRRLPVCLWMGLCVGLVITAIAVADGLLPLPNADPAVVQSNAWGRILFLAAICVLLGVGPLRPTTWAQLGPQSACLILLWLDFRLHHPNLTPVIPASAMRPGIAEIQPVPIMGLAGRVLVSHQADQILARQTLSDPTSDFLIQRLALWANLHLLEKVPKVSGDSTLHIREALEIEQLAAAVPPDYPLLDFLSVSHVTQTNQLFEWQKKERRLLWMTCGQEPRALEGTNLLQRLASPDFNPRREVYLAAMDLQAETLAAQPSAILGSGRGGLQEIETVIKSPAPTLVVISQSYYPRWRAWVDGQPVPVLRANYAFQAVRVPGGEHRVELRYVDSVFRLGAWISLSCLLVMSLRMGWSLVQTVVCRRRPIPAAAS